MQTSSSPSILVLLTSSLLLCIPPNNHFPVIKTLYSSRGVWKSKHRDRWSDPFLRVLNGRNEKSRREVRLPAGEGLEKGVRGVFHAFPRSRSWERILETRRMGTSPMSHHLLFGRVLNLYSSSESFLKKKEEGKGEVRE